MPGFRFFDELHTWSSLPSTLGATAGGDAVKVLAAADVDSPSRDRGRGEYRLAKRVGSEDLKLRPGRNNKGVAVLAGQEDLSIEGYWRSLEACWDLRPAIVQYLPG